MTKAAKLVRCAMMVAFFGCAKIALGAGVVGTGTSVSCTEAAFDTALTGGGSVTFNCGASPVTIIFTATKGIAIATAIDGGDLITLSGGGSVRLFTVTSGGLSVVNITLANGHDTPVNFGAAAIEASAPVSITDSTITGHQSSNGGCPAISVTSTLSITRSTIQGNVNSALATGNAVCGNNTSTVTIVDSTFNGNTGGGLFSSGIATLTNVTVAGNTAGSALVAFASGAITLQNSIIANNTGGAQCNAAAGGTITDGGGNVQFPATDCGVTIISANPLLGVLANNGGPTQTMAIGAGSPAIDRGVVVNCPATDQRGVAPTDGNGDTLVVCDSGAFEAPVGAPPPPAIPLPSQSLWALIMLGFALAAHAMWTRRRQ